MSLSNRLPVASNPKLAKQVASVFGVMHIHALLALHQCFDRRFVGRAHFERQRRFLGNLG